METTSPDHPGSDLEILKKMEDEHLRLQRQVLFIHDTNGLRIKICC